MRTLWIAPASETPAVFANPPFRMTARALAPIGAVILAMQPLCLPAASAQTLAAPLAAPLAAAPAPTYADLADLADNAGIVVRAEVRKATRLKPEQATGVKPGWARFYIEARTQALLLGRSGADGLGESLKYLADVKLSADGRPPKLRKAVVLLFANPVAGRAGELRLVAPDAQVVSDAALEGRVRSLLTELVAPDAAPPIAAVREALYVPGNLAGEGETQIFLATRRGDPVSLTVISRPAQPPQWGVSLSEIVDQSTIAPARDTLTWYRLACFLPKDLPRETLLSGSAQDRRKASDDYRLIIDQLGPCPRTRS